MIKIHFIVFQEPIDDISKGFQAFLNRSLTKRPIEHYQLLKLFKIA